MKRFYSLLFFVTLFVAVSAQAPKRLVLIEEFTNTGCGPCASWSPILDSCINYRLGDCIAIKYHSRFPNASDEFYNNEAEANQTRVDYYHVSGVPATYVDGQELDYRSFEYLNQAISYCREQPAKCAINISGISIRKESEGTQMSVMVKVSESDEQNSLQQSDNVRLFVCLIEEHIRSSKPFPNGENELYYTMRQMLSPVNGQTLEEGVTEYTVADYINLEAFGGTMPNDLGIVAFVQDMDTKEIWNAAYHGPEAEGENKLVAQTLFDTPDMICTPDYYGKVIFRNDGANTITEATLNVRVNNVEKQYAWSGSLGYLDRDTLEFDGFTEFSLTPEPSSQNEVWVWFSEINGTEAESNMLVSSFSNSIQATYGVQLKIYTDKKPEETTWKLYDSSGKVVREGGPYTGQARKFITVDFDLRRDDCYTLEFLDSGGDGITSSAYGKGYYQLFQKGEDGKTKRIAQGDYSGSVFDIQFHLDGAPKPPHRLVLFEEFTNTSCDPCADFSPALDEVIFRRLDDMVPITYHYNFPSPQDPFYLAAPGDVMTRASFYNVTGVPTLRVNGQRVGALGYEQYLDGYIDGAGMDEEKASVETTATLNGGLLGVKVSVTPLAGMGESCRLFTAVVEERVEWAQPAANGERSWNYVMRKMLPDANGQAIDPLQVTPQEYEFTWQVENFYDDTELGIVTFVQDMTTGEIIGTCYTPRPTGSTSAAKILKVMDTPDRICTPLFTSSLMVRNTGRDALTSATLNVSINGTVQQTPWTGRLEYLEIDTLRTPVFTGFSLNANPSDRNDVEIWLSDLNGAGEESVHKTFTLASAYRAQNAVRLTIMTDNAPEEITWKLFDSAGEVVAEGGPYTESRKKQVIDLPIVYDDCYTLHFDDAGGNGITGENGRGYYMLHEVSAEGKTRLLVQDTFTTSTHEVFFSLDNVARIQGDVNGDGIVDVADIAAVITVMASGGTDVHADVNADGIVDVADIAKVISVMAGN